MTKSSPSSGLSPKPKKHIESHGTPEGEAQLRSLVLQDMQEEQKQAVVVAREVVLVVLAVVDLVKKCR